MSNGGVELDVSLAHWVGELAWNFSHSVCGDGGKTLTKPVKCIGENRRRGL